MQSRFAGMTINERLLESGKLREWDAAVTAADREKMIAILESVELSDQAAPTADRILATLKFYGFRASRWSFLRRLFQKRPK